MLIIGYCYGIRSERRLCEEVHLNLAYRWFCHLGVHDRVPDHSTFSKTRHGRFRDSDAFRDLFASVLRRCIAEGMTALAKPTANHAASSLNAVRTRRFAR
jgi:transposase